MNDFSVSAYTLAHPYLEHIHASWLNIFMPVGKNMADWFKGLHL